MDQVTLVLTGLSVGLLIALAAIVTLGSRTPPPPTIFLPPPAPESNSGCAGILASAALMFVGLVFWLFVLM